MASYRLLEDGTSKRLLEDGTSFRILEDANNVTVTPGVVALTLTTFAPTVLVPRVVTPPTTSLAITAFAPIVLTPRRVVPPTIGLTLTTFPPTVTAGSGGPVVVTPGTATLTLTTFAPTVTAGSGAPPSESGRVFYEATWDARSDWLYDGSRPGWSTVGFGSDFLLDRVTSPQTPWLGACGRFKTAWTSGSGTSNPAAVPPALTRGRKHRSSWAMMWKGTSVGLSATRFGPVRLSSRNDAGGGLGDTFALTVSVTAGVSRLVAANLLNFSGSANSIILDHYLNEWLVFDCSAESTGSSAPYTTKVYFDVWVWRAGRLKFLTRLALPDYSGAVFDIEEWRLGYLLMAKNVDNVEILIDELRIDTGGGSVPLPRSPSLAFDSYQARAQIRKFDRATSTWGSAWDIDSRAITGLRCSYLAYRVEDSCEITLADPGRYTASTLQNILDDLEQNPKALYRLDVYAPDTTYANPQFPSTWRDDVIFWSGVLQRREPNRDQAARGITISAVGWTSRLSTMIVTKKIFYKKTINQMIASLLTQVSTYWPGTLSLVTRTNGLDSRLIVDERGWDGVPFDRVLGDLADLGQFFFGVSVCGYPSFDQSGGGEFRLVFMEPNAQVEAAVPAGAGLGDEVGIFFSTDDDRNIVALDHSIDDSKYANRWVVTGDSLHFDHISSIYILTGQYAIDPYANVSGTSVGLENFEGSLSGMQLTIVDKVHRVKDFIDQLTGSRFPAGWIGPLPQSLQRLLEGTTFVIIAQTATGGGNPFVLFDLGQVPLDDESATLITESLRYVLDAGGVRVQRTVGDYEDSGSGSTGRDRITRSIGSDQVRGWHGAGVLALQDRYAERLNAEQVRLKVAKWTRVPTGSRNQNYNLIGIAFGGERTTLIGTAAQGGDDWKYGDDERPCGGSRTYEIQSCEMQLKGGAWEVDWTLGAAPRTLQAILLPISSAFRDQPAAGPVPRKGF
jgi:hypothetical protein